MSYRNPLGILQESYRNDSEESKMVPVQSGASALGRGLESSTVARLVTRLVGEASLPTGFLSDSCRNTVGFREDSYRILRGFL